jgi:hypothetical protein
MAGKSRALQVRARCSERRLPFFASDAGFRLKAVECHLVKPNRFRFLLTSLKNSHCSADKSQINSSEKKIPELAKSSPTGARVTSKPISAIPDRPQLIDFDI